MCLPDTLAPKLGGRKKTAAAAAAATPLWGVLQRASMAGGGAQDEVDLGALVPAAIWPSIPSTTTTTTT